MRRRLPTMGRGGSSILTFGLLVVVLLFGATSTLGAQPKPRPGELDRKDKDEPVDPRDRILEPKKEKGEEDTKKDGDKGDKKEDGAEQGDASHHRLSGDAIGGFPVGDWADFLGVGIGAGVRYDYRLGDRWGLVTELAYLYHFENELRDATNASFSQTVTEMLLLFGGRYRLQVSDGPDEVFLLIMGGFNWLTVDTVFEDVVGQQDSVLTEQEFALLFGGGYDFDKFSVRAGLLISAIGKEQGPQQVNESPLADYTGTMSAVGMFGYHFYSF